MSTFGPDAGNNTDGWRIEKKYSSYWQHEYFVVFNPGNIGLGIYNHRSSALRAMKRLRAEEAAMFQRRRLPEIIGISGKAGHGKDTLAKLLVDNHGYYRRAFADALKEDIAHLLYGTSSKKGVKELEANKHKPEIRALLQSYGVAQREKDPHYWIRECLNRYQGVRAYKGGALTGLVIPDVRFKNEAEEVQRRGVLIRVVRDNFESGLTPEAQAHPSETDLDGWAFNLVIFNTGNPLWMLEQFNMSLELGSWMRS